MSALGITDKCFRFVIDGDMDIKLDPRLFQHGAPWFSFGKIDFKLCWNDDFDFVRRVLMSLCQMISWPLRNIVVITSNLLLMTSFHFTTLCSGLLSLTTNSSMVRIFLSILKYLRGNLRSDRSSTLSALRPRQYGSILASCQPVLRLGISNRRISELTGERVRADGTGNKGRDLYISVLDILFEGSGNPCGTCTWIYQRHGLEHSWLLFFIIAVCTYLVLPFLY